MIINVKHLIIDFSNVSFMDSSGIGVIMGRYKKIRYADGNIAVIGINKMIDRSPIKSKEKPGYSTKIDPKVKPMIA